MAGRFDPEDATFQSMRSQMMTNASRQDRTIVATDAARRQAYASGSATNIHANAGEVRGWRFDQKKNDTSDLIKKANDLANQNTSHVHVQANPGDKVQGWRFDQKDGNPDLIKKANEHANQNDSHVHVQTGYVIRSRGGRKVGAPVAQKAPMNYNNMNCHYVQQKQREVDALVAERARKMKK